MNWLFKFILALKGYLTFNKIQNKNMVIYFEGGHDIPHLMPIANELKKKGHNPILVTSEVMNDSGVIFVGNGFFRILFFQLLDCKNILMTMPDLDRLHIKRSKNPVKYSYVFHSLSSSHTIYHEEAFDAYDTIYAAGPHHVLELRKREEVFSVPEKNIVEGGYPRVDSLISSNKTNETKKKNITIAPTWGNGSLLENEKTMDIIKFIVGLNFDVYLRVHPMTNRHHPHLIKEIKKRFKDNSNFYVETDMKNQTNLYESFMMVSDWSGAAFEFGLTQKCPVLFIDTPQKINNDKHTALGLPAAEYEIRKEIGEVIGLDELEKIANITNGFYENKSLWKEKISSANSNYIYNIGNAANIISNDLIQQLK